MQGRSKKDLLDDLVYFRGIDRSLRLVENYDEGHMLQQVLEARQCIAGIISSIQASLYWIEEEEETS